jgi:hypothetical protein
MTEKIERENKELKLLTKGLVEARKTQKKLNEEFAQLRKNDSLRATSQAMGHSSAQQVTDSIEFPDEIDSTMTNDPFTASKRPGSSSEDENRTYEWKSQIQTTTLDQKKMTKYDHCR